MLHSQIGYDLRELVKGFPGPSVLGQGVEVRLPLSRTLSLMSRYESRHQRVHDKAYAALRELQKARASQPAQPPPSPEKENLRNEPTAPSRSSPDIHLCTPVAQVPDLPSAPKTENSEDHDT
jgi:hypothetical protein